MAVVGPSASRQSIPRSVSDWLTNVVCQMCQSVRHCLQVAWPAGRVLFVPEIGDLQVCDRLFHRLVLTDRRNMFIHDRRAQ